MAPHFKEELKKRNKRREVKVKVKARRVKKKPANTKATIRKKRGKHGKGS